MSAKIKICIPDNLPSWAGPGVKVIYLPISWFEFVCIEKHKNILIHSAHNVWYLRPKGGSQIMFASFFDHLPPSDDTLMKSLRNLLKKLLRINYKISNFVLFCNSWWSLFLCCKKIAYFASKLKILSTYNNCGVTLIFKILEFQKAESTTSRSRLDIWLIVRLFCCLVQSHFDVFFVYVWLSGLV